MADSWTTRTALPVNHRLHGAASIGSKLYVNGGYSNATTKAGFETNEHQEYDPSGNSWLSKTQMTSGQEPRETPCTAYDSNLYIAVNNASGWTRKYSQSGNSWTLIDWGQSLGSGDQKGSGAALLSSGKIYKFGSASSSFMSECWEGDVPSLTKTQKQSMPTGHMQPGYFSIGTDKAYAVGGKTSITEEFGNDESTVYEYSQAGNNWLTRTQLPINNHYMTSFGLDTNLAFVCGGGPTGGATAATYKYTQNTNVWTAMSNMPAANWQCAGDSVGGTKGYSFGGKSNITANYEYLAVVLEALEDLKTELIGDWPTGFEDFKTDLRAYQWASEYLKCELVGSVIDALEDLKTLIAGDAWDYDDIKTELTGYAQALEELKCELISDLFAYEHLKCELKVADRDNPYVVLASLSPVFGQTAIPVNSNIVIKIRDDGWGVDPTQCWVDVREIITDGYGEELCSTTTRYKQGVTGFSYQLSNDKRECIITIDPQTDFGYNRKVEVKVFAVDLAGNCGTVAK